MFFVHFLLASPTIKNRTLLLVIVLTLKVRQHCWECFHSITTKAYSIHGQCTFFLQSTYYSNPYCSDITSDRPLPFPPFLLHKLASGILIRVGWETATCAINEQITNLYFNGSPVKLNVVMKIHQGIPKITATKRYDKDIRARGINGPQAIYSSFAIHCKVLYRIWHIKGYVILNE